MAIKVPPTTTPSVFVDQPIGPAPARPVNAPPQTTLAPPDLDRLVEERPVANVVEELALPPAAVLGEANVGVVAALRDHLLFGLEPNVDPLGLGELGLTDPDFHFNPEYLKLNLGDILSEHINEHPESARAACARALLDSYPGGLGAVSDEELKGLLG